MKSNSFAWIVVVVISSHNANAASVAFPSWHERPFTAAEIHSGAPVGGKLLSFLVTTDADILSVGRVLATTTGTFSQLPTPPPFDLPSEPLPPFFPYIETPGTTIELGKPFPGDGTDNSAWGDTQDNGPQSHFKFAQLVISPASAAWSFSGNIAVAGATGPELFPFSFGVPEPASGLLAISSVVSAFAVRRRYARRAHRPCDQEVS
jgi:hypothetical protein